MSDQHCGLLHSEEETKALAAAVAAAVAGAAAPVLMGLEGNLGAGKSFFARSLLSGQGVTGPVRSPTYTLIEPYDCDLGMVLHLDLYRLADPDEMLFLGLDDLQPSAALTMVEWPEKAGAFWPYFDLTLRLSVEADHRSWQLLAGSALGEMLLAKFSYQQD